MTPKGWNEIPAELLRQVFGHLQNIINTSKSYTKHTELHQSFAACQLVCRSWSAEAQRMLYSRFTLGKNIVRFVHTTTVEAPEIALLSYIQQLFTQCRELISIEADSPAAFNQFIWPVLLRNDVHLPKLQKACLFNKNECDERLLMQFQSKYRHSLTTIYIKSTDSYIYSMENFALKTLNVHYCVSSTHTVLDAILNKCPSTLKYLKINTLNAAAWNAGSFGDVVPLETLQTVCVESLRNADSAPLQYILRKFPAMSKLVVKSLHCDNQNQEIGATFWDHLLLLYSRLTYGQVDIALHAFDLSTLVANSLHVLSQLDRSKRTFSIVFRDKVNGPIVSGPSGVMLIMSKESLHCGLEAKSIEINKQHVLDNIHYWMQLYKPTHIEYSAVERIGDIYKRLFATGKKRLNAVLQTLSEQYSEKSWKLLMEAIDVADEIKLGHFVLCNPEPSILLNHDRQRPLSTLIFSACIISDSILPEISRRLPEIDLLRFQCTSFLRKEKHTLKMFMPFTKMNKMYLNAATLATGSWLGSVYNYDSPSRLNDTSSANAQRYTLKIETDTGTTIYNIDGQKSEKLFDQNADEFMRGTARNVLVWIKCKAFGQYAISCKGDVWSYYDLDHA
ncbi:hypothetical protein MBANPS3_010948 [Mucor bainieri]